MPNLALDLVELVLLALSLACAVYWGVVWVSLIRTRRALPTARDGIALADAAPPTERVCVVVPAHNEADNIATLIGSLRAQDYDRLRVVLALDRCTDDTRGVALEAIGGDHRFEIVEVERCPDEWAGKVHAAYSGVERSEHAKKADVLIFTDADTWFDPSCVRAALALARDRDLELLSLLSTLESRSWFERLVQPAAGFELMRQFPLLSVNQRGDERRSFANGQFMLFDANAYHALDGHAHERIRDALLEDLAFANLYKHRGRHGGLFLGDGMLRCAMYPGWDAFVRGWKRIYTESANREVERLRRYAWRVPIVNAVLPLAALACVVMSITLGDTPTAIGGGVLGAAAILFWLGAVVSIQRAGRARVLDAPGFLIGSVLVGRIFKLAARDLSSGAPTLWGGRSYTRRVAGRA